MSGTLRSDNISLLEQTLSLVYNSRYSNRKHYSVIAENKIDIGEPKKRLQGLFGHMSRVHYYDLYRRRPRLCFTDGSRCDRQWEGLRLNDLQSTMLSHNMPFSLAVTYVRHVAPVQVRVHTCHTFTWIML